MTAAILTRGRCIFGMGDAQGRSSLTLLVSQRDYTCSVKLSVCPQSLYTPQLLSDCSETSHTCWMWSPHCLNYFLNYRSTVKVVGHRKVFLVMYRRRIVIESRDWCHNVGELNINNFCIWHFGLWPIVSNIARGHISDPLLICRLLLSMMWLRQALMYNNMYIMCMCTVVECFIWEYQAILVLEHAMHSMIIILTVVYCTH